MTDAGGVVAKSSTQATLGNGVIESRTYKADMGTVVPGAVTDRGYTGHEHLDEVGLIHMNGRVQDPVLGRFISADPFIPDPSDAQSYNRYSYVRPPPCHWSIRVGFGQLYRQWRFLPPDLPIK